MFEGPRRLDAVERVRWSSGCGPPSGHTHRALRSSEGDQVAQLVWTVEEMILAADFADSRDWTTVNKGTPGVDELSDLLRMATFYPVAARPENFRSLNSIGRKTNNLIASHPESKGKGLRTSASEVPVVERFVENRLVMKRVAKELRERIRAGTAAVGDADKLYREYSAAIDAEAGASVHRKSESLDALATVCAVDSRTHSSVVGSIVSRGDSLDCDLCGFDFEHAYGRLGRGYIELHVTDSPTSVGGDDSEVLPVCSNCHRMLHRGRGAAVDVLRSALET